jgi:hypothetical protein
MTVAPKVYIFKDFGKDIANQQRCPFFGAYTGGLLFDVVV